MLTRSQWILLSFLSLWEVFICCHSQVKSPSKEIKHYDKKFVICKLFTLTLPLQSPKSGELNKRTTSPKGGKARGLVNVYVQNQHNSHETHGKGNSSFNFSKKTSIKC